LIKFVKIYGSNWQVFYWIVKLPFKVDIPVNGEIPIDKVVRWSTLREPQLLQVADRQEEAAPVIKDQLEDVNVACIDPFDLDSELSGLVIWLKAVEDEARREGGHGPSGVWRVARHKW